MAQEASLVDPYFRKEIEGYLSWIRERVKAESLENGWVCISTPYLDRHSDFLQIYVRRAGDGFEFSDDGFVLTDLEQAGCSINTPKRKEIFSSALLSFGMQEHDGVLTAAVPEQDFAPRKHLFVQGLLALGDMFYLSAQTVFSVFREDVERWLSVNDVRFSPTIKLTGKTGYDHVFDFVIPRSKEAPERLIRALPRPSSDSAKAMVFSWIDTKEVRGERTKALAILNDQEATIPAGVEEALKIYNVQGIPWSQRERYLGELAA